MSATMTLIGLYNYQDDLFDDLSLPEGIDKQTFIDNLLLRSGDFELLYPNGDFMKDAIRVWSAKWYATFERWVKALAIEYDPLENYDRREEWQDTVNAKTTGSASGSTGGTTGSTTTNSVSAYDGGNAYTPKDQSVLSGTDSSTSNSSSSSQENRGAKHEGRTHGNIGVTTSQMMLLSELDLGYWNLYERMIGLFLTEFVLPIY